MSNNLIIQTLDNTPSALIIGNPHNLGLRLALTLLKKHVQVTLCTKPITADQQLLQLAQSSPLFSISQIKSLSLQNKFNYIFHLFNPSKKNLNSLNTSLNFSKQSGTRFSLVTLDEPKNKTKQAKHQRAHQLVSQALNKNQLNARVIHINHLFGPGGYLPRSNPLYHIFSQVLDQDFKITGTHDFPVFPLYIDDAIEAIIKATFSSNTRGQILELGGQPVSLLNLSLKVRSILAPQDHLPSSHQTQIEPLPIDVQGQILTTHEELNWAPQADLTQALKQTILWLENNPHPRPKPHKETPPKLSQNFLTESIETPINIVQEETPPTPPPNHLPPSSEPSIQGQTTSFSSPKTFSIGDNPPQQRQSSLLKIDHQPLEEIVHTESASPKSNSKKMLLMFFLLFLTPLFVFTSTLIFAYYNLVQLNSAFKSGQLQKTARLSQTSYSTFSFLQDQIDFAKPLVQIFIGSKRQQNLTDLMYLAKTSAQAAEHASNTLDSTSSLLQYILGHSQGNIPMTLATTDTSLQQTYHDLSNIQAKISQNPDLLTFPFGIGDKIQNLKNQIDTFKPYLFQTHQLITQSPNLLGFSSTQTYLVLLQNNAELRPTGGFIGSFALITFDQGKLTDIHVEDVYNADGQLRGHVEPPPAIKKYLGEAGWFLRDVNWDPNFPSSAASAIWFLDKELSIKPSGVVGINLHVIKALLQAVGPIDVPDYDETINATNLFERVEYQVEINQFPGSTQKRDFLGKLTDSLINKILQADQSLLLKLAPLLTQSADQNQITIFLQDQIAQKTIESLGWSGQIVNPQCHPQANTKNCLNDYLGIFEANVGVNKANYFVTRNIDHQVTIQEDGGVVITSTLTHQNTSQAENWPGGTYRDYLRFYTPQGSRFISAQVNNQQLLPQDLDTYLEHDKTILGFLVNTPPLTTTTTSVTYRLADKINLNQPFSYSLFFQKQPGTSADPISFTLNYPPQFQAINSSVQPLSTANPSSHSFTFSTNKHLLFEFAK